MYSGCPSVRTFRSRDRVLKNRLMDYRQTWVMFVSCRSNEVIRLLGLRGQRSQGSLCMQK